VTFAAGAQSGSQTRPTFPIEKRRRAARNYEALFAKLWIAAVSLS
jgi:hypothetical protein